MFSREIITAVLLLIAHNAFRLQRSELYMYVWMVQSQGKWEKIRKYEISLEIRRKAKTVQRFK